MSYAPIRKNCSVCMKKAFLAGYSTGIHEFGGSAGLVIGAVLGVLVVGRRKKERIVNS